MYLEINKVAKLLQVFLHALIIINCDIVEKNIFFRMLRSACVMLFSQSLCLVKGLRARCHLSGVGDFFKV